MGTRFLAVLAVVALGAGSAMVGLTMAQGSWNVAGTGLEPGLGYALHLGADADRLKVELNNLTGDAVASFAVFAPDGSRAGFYGLDVNTKSAEVATGAGDWLVFVYKSQGGDLALSFHGASADAGKFAPANIERREFNLGSVPQTKGVNADYTAVIGKAPVLVNVLLQGSARNFHSELSSDKGVVEVVSISEVAGTMGGGIVDSKGERATMPQNLVAGSYTAKVTADSLSGELVLAALYLTAPEFASTEKAVEADPSPEAAPTPPTPPPSSGHRPHKAPAAPHKSHTALAKSEVEFAECGDARAFVPYGLTVAGGAMMRLTLGERQDPAVSVFDTEDHLLKVVDLKKEGQSDKVLLPSAGMYVLYARGADVKVGLAGVEKCELQELKVQPVTVATLSSGELLGGAWKANFSLVQAPLEFGLRLASPDSAAMGLHADFKGPSGVAAQTDQGFSLGLIGASDGGLGGLGGLPFMGSPDGSQQQSSRDGLAQADAKKMVDGPYDLTVSAQVANGQFEAFALQYLREAAQDSNN